MKSDNDIAADLASEGSQVDFFRKHPEVLLAPHGNMGPTIRAACGLRTVDEICAEMDRILAGRSTVCGVVDGSEAELHGPSSTKGKGGYYFRSLEVAARITQDKSWDAWVPGGFSIVAIGREDVKEKLGIFERSSVVVKDNQK
jgi:hypothetical protein